MKIKRIAALAICASLALNANISLAHGHHNYDYGYDHDGYDCGSYGGHAHLDGICPYYTDETAYQYYQAATVKKVQQKLNSLGYDAGTADGVYGAATKSSIKKFQRQKNMSVTGLINNKLLKKLKIK